MLYVIFVRQKYVQFVTEMSDKNGLEGDDMELEEGDLESTLQLAEEDSKQYYSLQVHTFTNKLTFSRKRYKAG